MSRMIDCLEPRRLLSHSLPDAFFAHASDRYTLTIDTQVVDVSLTSVAWSVAATGPAAVNQPFAVTLPSGASSATLFQLVVSGQPIQQVRVEALTDTQRLRTSWDMRNAQLQSFSQFLGPDGILYDSVTVFFNRMINTFYTPGPAGVQVAASFDWNFNTNSGGGSQPVETFYMSTSPGVRSTMEFGRGQMPLSSYSFGISGPVPTPLEFGGAAGVDGVGLLTQLLRRQIVPEGVHLQRDDQARPVTRTRFIESIGRHYAFSDSILDDQPRIETFRFEPLRAQILSYSYHPSGSMQPPTSSGWNFPNNTAFNPPTVTAFIRPPTYGPRNTPLDSVEIEFTSGVAGLTLGHFSFEGLSPAGLTLTSASGGTVWTIGNLAPQQTADGDYGIKLFAIDSGITSGTAPLVGSTGIKWTLDTVPPAVTVSSFEFETGHSLRLGFSEDVSASLSPVSIVLENLTHSTTIPSGAMALVYHANTDTATVTFPGLANGILPDGNYRATLLASGVSDPAGNTLTGDHTLDFFFVAGDANRDGRVNLADFNILAANFGQSPRTFSQGDFNYDGVVNLADFNILAGKFGFILPGTAASPFASIKFSATGDETLHELR